MSRTFVLDENIVVLAGKLQNEYGHNDTLCYQLLDEIAKGSHAIAVNSAWEENFYSMLSEIAARFSNAVRILRLVRQLSSNPERYLRIDVDETIEMADCVKNDDHWIVQLACTVQDVFATTDNPLIECLTTSSMTDKYRFKAVRPEDDLPFAMESGS